MFETPNYNHHNGIQLTPAAEEMYAVSIDCEVNDKDIEFSKLREHKIVGWRNGKPVAVIGGQVAECDFFVAQLGNSKWGAVGVFVKGETRPDEAASALKSAIESALQQKMQAELSGTINPLEDEGWAGALIKRARNAACGVSVPMFADPHGARSYAPLTTHLHPEIPGYSTDANPLAP